MRPLSETTIARKLNKLGAEVMSRYPRINAGGCCVYAALVGAKLAKLLPTQVRVEGSYRACRTNIDHIRPRKAENEDFDWGHFGVVFNHVIVSYEVNGKTWFYDARGARTKYKPLCSDYDPDMVLFGGSLSITETSYLASESTRWNSSFDRADIPDLIDLVDSFFSKEFKIH